MTLRRTPADVCLTSIGGLAMQPRGRIAVYTGDHLLKARTAASNFASLRRRSSAPLDELRWQMAVDVAAQIIGLTDSDSNVALAER